MPTAEERALQREQKQLRDQAGAAEEARRNEEIRQWLETLDHVLTQSLSHPARWTSRR